MEQQIAIIYSSVDGHTKKICEELLTVIQRNGISAELFSINNFDRKIRDFHTIIIGASVRYGRHNENVEKFIVENKFLLSQINTTFFSVNLVARKPEKNTPETNPYFIKFIKKVDWKPDQSAVFAGKLDYSSYSFWDSIMIKMIMWMTHGPTHSKAPIEYTDCKKVRDLGENICKSVYKSSEEAAKKD